MRKNNYYILAIFIALLLNGSSYAQEYKAYPARTAFSDDAFPVDNKNVELELGWSLEEKHWVIPFLLKYSPVNNLEIGVSISGILDHDGHQINKTEFGEPGIQFKWLNLSKGDIYGSLVSGISFPHYANPTLLLYYVVSLDYSRILINLHAGGYLVENNNNKYSEALTYAVSFIPKFKGNFGFFGELHGEKLENELILMTNAGVSYSINDTVIFDAAFDVGLNDLHNIWILSLGVTAELGKF